ncbi:hypothetical protein BD779DRAFT_1470652 [Infundibulicybe gibba]|nr:hypothetical protein BD779DRAFT_1470652 [Infundibulicybe gibba]
MSPHDLVAVGAAVGLSAPSPLGLPVYSASGFDLLSILARVATRPHPRVVLGPVDLTCSFVVVDVRRHDHPIVYCSPSFCRLTGYEEREVLAGRTTPLYITEAVAHLRKSLTADKECQTSIINYRKGGAAFINLVTVIPIAGGASGSPQEDNEVVYHVGFQVDLTEQPNAILRKLHDGSYLVNYSSQPGFLKLLANPKFIQSIPITTTTTVSTALSNEKTSETHENNQILNLILLEASPDFIHVVSLKGSFLYVAPSVRRVLGYEPEELVGKSIADFTHPEDVVPLMRELKESSATGPSAAGTISSQDNQTQSPQFPITPRTVDLLFRARIKTGVYVWVECRGRLHVEPGKGRKAIVLSGRAREMPRLPWANIARGGGVAQPVRVKRTCSNADGAMAVETVDMQREFWGTVNAKGTLLVVGSGVADVLGWNAAELTGRMMATLLFESDNSYHILEEELVRMSYPGGSDAPKGLYCRMKRRDGSAADIHLVLYRPTQDPLFANASESVSPSPLIYQIRTIDGSSPPPAPPLLSRDPTVNVFEELEVSRGSSWQYELQQLKFANQRLLDELHALEAQYQSQKTHPSPHFMPSPVSLMHSSGPVVHAPSPQQPSPRPDTAEWSASSGSFMHRQFPPPSTLKRPWHAIDGTT